MASSNTETVSLPRDVKDAVSRCRAATQEALKGQLSRMDIEFPVGTKFGVEKYPKVKSNDGGPTKSVLDQSDRELARLFVDMFQPVGGENIVVAFTEQSLADAAKKKWKGDPTATSQVMAMNRRKASKNKKKSKPKGFAAKLAAEVEDSADSSGPFELPDGCQVALFVSPGPKELVVIEKICEQVGMGACVILLNARLSKISNFGTDTAAQLFSQDFKSVFSLTAAPQDEAPNCLLYHAYPGSWTLARKPTVGQPKSILTQDERPTGEECRAAFESLELSDLEKGVENALENVAGWFK